MFKYCLFENILLNAIVFFIFFKINPVKENFINMNIHPLVIVVTAMALIYGNYLGIMSALIASVTFIYAYYLLGRDLYLFFIDYSYYKFLLMFFICAFVFGKFKDNCDFKVDNLKLKNEILRKNYEDLKEGYEKLRFIKEELRKQIVGAEYSIVSLYEIASKLETLDSEEIYTEIMYILSKFLKARTMSIYTVSDDNKYLRLKLKKGEDKIIPNSIKISDKFCYKKLINGKITIKRNGECENEFPLLSGPIVKDNKVIAVINIESMDFEMVTEYSFNLFKVIVDWINRALAQAIEVESKLNKKKYYKDTNIMKYEFFKERLDEEKERKRRYNLDYGFLKFKNNDVSIKYLDSQLSKLIRNVDVVAYDEKNDILYILLPATPSNMSYIIEKRILEGFNFKLERLKDEC
ncbi:GAF domain-containing protein [Tepidibacter thalassicus]|uniref:GAF domain-containing protein n=1 Tax=Tepidibacter thalassicus DSM 15285 TaxID=1123350 RepID=A0A1M5NXT2_9FIRM|nr:hypothetical protein [Tepidibacter thalassicus]SHG94331.1 hypothetical protein SAMN02744040_00280 [Tepidibacter thalassicus DSM 15285]